MFSVEVSSGFFSAKLPSELTSTSELKLNNSKQWQPLQSLVEISSYFTVKAKGIRFRGTINHCNGLLEQLLYYGDGHGEGLRIRINDLGWYGCYQDCTDKISVPLISEATINLIRSMPVSSVAAHSLGSVIVTESIVFTMLAMIVTESQLSFLFRTQGALSSCFRSICTEDSMLQENALVIFFIDIFLQSVQDLQSLLFPNLKTDQSRRKNKLRTRERNEIIGTSVG